MKRSKHNLSHYRLTTFDMGQLVPVGCVEVLPGDSFRHSASAMVRAATLVAPLMHPVTVRIHHWYVPNRVVWPEFADFISGQDAGANSVPTHTESPTADGLLDHLGVPTGTSVTVNELPIRAYNLIWNTFYRDQDLMAERAEDATTLARIAWEKDYFTSARTYPQFGSTTMSIPFTSGLAPIKGFGLETGSPVTASVALRETDETVNAAATRSPDPNDWIMAVKGTAPNRFPDINADLSQATGGLDVNEVRRAIALQKLLENRNRYGSRYRDYLRYLGIRPSDGRLEEPEYLGGGKQQIAFSEVLATAEGTSTDVGDQAGHGIAAMRTRPYTRFFEESGYVLSLMSVRPKAMYMNMIERHWFRSSKDDFWQKEYEAFGPQAILVKEAYNAHANTTDILGYADRFREYREMQSTVHGDFRDTTSDYWHLARKLTASPSLNESFVTCTPTDRVYADTNEPELKCMVRHRLTARRLVSKNPRPM